MPALVAALIAAAVSLATLGINAWMEARRRRQEMFAEAYAVYRSYREFPYVVRRRRHDDAVGERVRISEQLRAVQERIAFFEAWTMLASPAAGRAYKELIHATRRIAGGAISGEWGTAAMQVPVGTTIDLSELDRYDEAYLTALRRHMQSPWTRFIEWWRRRG